MVKITRTLFKTRKYQPVWRTMRADIDKNEVNVGLYIGYYSYNNCIIFSYKHLNHNSKQFTYYIIHFLFNFASLYNIDLWNLRFLFILSVFDRFNMKTENFNEKSEISGTWLVRSNVSISVFSTSIKNRYFFALK